MMKVFTNVKIGVLCVALCLMFPSLSVSAQGNNADQTDFTMDVSLNSDQFFGFYPVLQGGVGMAKDIKFTFYGIMWSGGTGAAWGNWTEFGVGVNIKAADGLNINPQIGVLGGTLLSSGADGTPGRFGDGIVPNITVNLDKSSVEGQLYAGFYLPVRDEAKQAGTTLSYLHYWVNAGYKVSDVISFGAHYEHLINSGGSNVKESTDVYQWVGPYIQFRKPGGGHFVRFSGGTDMAKDKDINGNDIENRDGFFKLTLGLSL
jgi:hypothetical protein